MKGDLAHNGKLVGIRGSLQGEKKTVTKACLAQRSLGAAHPYAYIASTERGEDADREEGGGATWAKHRMLEFELLYLCYFRIETP